MLLRSSEGFLRSIFAAIYVQIFGSLGAQDCSLTLPFWVPRTPHDKIAKSTRVNLSRGPPDPPRHFRQEDPGGIVMQGFPRMSSSCFRLRHFFSRERRFLKIGLLSQITFKSLIQFRLEGRKVNLFIHPPTSRSPAPAASTGNNLREFAFSILPSS